MSTLILISIIIPKHYLMLLLALIFLGSPSSFIRLAAAANKCFGADDGGDEGILSNAARDYLQRLCQ